MSKKLFLVEGELYTFKTKKSWFNSLLGKGRPPVLEIKHGRNYIDRKHAFKLIIIKKHHGFDEYNTKPFINGFES